MSPKKFKNILYSETYQLANFNILIQWFQRYSKILCSLIYARHNHDVVLIRFLNYHFDLKKSEIKNYKK